MEEKYKEKTSYSGPISLVSEVGHWKYVQEKDAIEENMEDAEKLMINYDGEAVAYYSNNNQAKKFYKKLVLGTFKGKKIIKVPFRVQTRMFKQQSQTILLETLYFIWNLSLKRNWLMILDMIAIIVMVKTIWQEIVRWKKKTEKNKRWNILCPESWKTEKYKKVKNK